MLGFHPEYEGFHLNPCLPSEWDSCRFERQFRGNRYRIEIRNPDHVQSGVVSLELDGAPIAGTYIAYVEDGRDHTVTVTMG